MSKVSTFQSDCDQRSIMRKSAVPASAITERQAVDYFLPR
jgi:hypothetical protein